MFINLYCKNKNINKIIKYLFCGLFIALIYLIIFNILYDYLNLPIPIVIFFAYTVSAFIRYLIHAKFIFFTEKLYSKDMIVKYIILLGIMYFLNVVSVLSLETYLNLSSLSLSLMSGGLNAFIGYVLSSKWVFK